MDEFQALGDIIDKTILDNDVWLMVKIPSGTMEPVIESYFGKFATMDFYLLLHALRKTVAQVMIDADTDPEKKEAMIDGMLGMVKEELMKAEAEIRD